MTSRERVRSVINHRPADRVPSGLGGCETTGLHIITYNKLQHALGMPDIPPRLDTFMLNAVFEKEMLETAECDIVLIASPRMCKSRLWGSGYENEWKEQNIWNKTFRVSVKDQFTIKPDGTYVWETARGAVCPPGSVFFDWPGVSDPLAKFEYMSPVDYNPPMELGQEMLRILEESARIFYDETGYCICMGETITDLQISPGGMLGGMVLMMEEPEVFREFLQKSLESGLSQLKMLDQAVGKYTDLLSIAHDFGDNKCVTIGAPLWREIYKPFYKKLFTEWKKITNMKINLHTCGSVDSILEDLIECGLDIINPVQISANGMDAASLKKRFGGRLVFWGGGYDAQMFSPDDSYDHVYEVVAEQINIFKQGGGYIFSGVHNLPPDVPESHLLAMLNAWKDNRDMRQ